jgi:hypothetical protein
MLISICFGFINFISTLKHKAKNKHIHIQIYTLIKEKYSVTIPYLRVGTAALREKSFSGEGKLNIESA